MRKWNYYSFIIVLIIIIATILQTVFSKDNEYAIDRVDIKAELLTDGDLMVQEMFTYTFNGSWNGTTRYLDTKGQKAVEYFKAYIPPKDKLIGDFTEDNLKELDVELDSKSHTYYAYTASKDETKRVYYRYRVDKAAIRYSDTGELYWSFLTHDNEKVGEVDLQLFLPQDSDNLGVNFFLRDRTGGGVLSLKQNSSDSSSFLYYHNKNLPKKGTVRMRVLFPESWLSDIPASESALLVKEVLAKEKARDHLISTRAEYFSLLDKMLYLITGLILAVSLLYLFAPRRIRGFLRRSELTPARLGEMDPLLAAYIYRNGRLKKRDLFAGVFSMRQRGLVIMKQGVTPARFEDDAKAPEFMPKFLFQGARKLLNPVDLFMVTHFFQNQGNEFQLESVNGPTSMERNRRSKQQKYHEKALNVDKKFKDWSLLVAKQDSFRDSAYKNTLWRPLWVGLSLLHLVFVLCLFYADATSWLILCSIAVPLTLGAALTMIFYSRRWLMILYLGACTLSMIVLTNIDAVLTYLLCILCSVLLVGIVPRNILSPEAAWYRSALKVWRRQLKKGQIHAVSNGADSVTLASEFALTLDVGASFLKSVQVRGAVANTEPSTLRNLALFGGVLYSQQTIAYMSPLPSSGGNVSNDGGGGGGAGGGDGGGGGGTGAF